MKDRTFQTAMTAVILAFGALIYATRPPNKDEVPKISLRTYGTVTDVASCSGHKYGLDCRVTVTKNDKQYSYRLDVTDFPGDIIQRGDLIGYQITEYKRVVHTDKFRNGKVRGSTTCYSWMSCWKNRHL